MRLNFLSLEMKKMNFVLVLIVMMVSTVATAGNDQTILIPANYDENDVCIDFIVGYGQEIEPTQLKPVSAEKAAVMSDEHVLREVADAAFALAGIEAAAEEYRKSPLVESVSGVCGNTFLVTWVNSGEEENKVLPLGNKGFQHDVSGN